MSGRGLAGVDREIIGEKRVLWQGQLFIFVEYISNRI
jgi:hypothetical protein